MLVISRGHREWKSCVATSVLRKRPWIRWTPKPCSQWSVSMGVECRSLTPLGFLMVYISENPQCVVTVVGKWRNHGIFGVTIFSDKPICPYMGLHCITPRRSCARPRMLVTRTCSRSGESGQQFCTSASELAVDGPTATLTPVSQEIDTLG